MPWYRRNKDVAFWLDRLALIGFAMVPSLILLDYGLWWSDVFNFLKKDFLSGDGYIYKYQTLLSAFIAFIAVFIAYVIAHYNDRKASYLAISNVVSLTNGLRGKLKYFNDTSRMIRDVNSFEFYINQLTSFADEISTVVDHIRGSNCIENCKIEISPVVDTFITILMTFESKLRSIDIYTNIFEDGSYKLIEDEAVSIEELMDGLNEMHENLQKYLDKEFCYN